MARTSTAHLTRLGVLLFGMLSAVLLAHIAPDANAATPVRGLSKVPARNVSAGYLNAIRLGTGSTSNKVASLNYEAVDIILLAFTGLNADASLDLAYGNSDVAHTLSWPAAAPGFRLQFNTNIVTTNWTAPSGTPLVRGEFYELHLTNAATRFYRLAQP